MDGLLEKCIKRPVRHALRKIDRRMAVRPKTFFLHIPKCAGTSVWRLLSDIYGRDGVFIVGNAEQRQQFAEMSVKQRSSFGAIGGHADVNYFMQKVRDPANYFKFVTFRHPVERVVSNYWYSHARFEPVSKLSLIQFAQTPHQINMQTTFMCGEADPLRAMNNLDEYFDDWYMMEDLDRLPGVLRQRLGKRLADFPHENKGRSLDNDAKFAAILAEIERVNEADMAFYAMLRDRRATPSVQNV